jgi:hypothetical protein
MLCYAARFHKKNFKKISKKNFKKKISKKNSKKKNSKFLNIFREFFWLFIFRSQFGVCLQKFGWSRPAGLGEKGIRTNRLAKLLYRLN